MSKKSLPSTLAATNDPTEYVLSFDYPSPRNPGEGVLFPALTVVHDVMQDNGIYFFRVKATGKAYQATWDPQMFSLNTPENRSRLRLALQMREVYLTSKKIMLRLFRDVKHVASDAAR